MLVLNIRVYILEQQVGLEALVWEKTILSAEVIAYPELGPEAVRKLGM